MDQTQHITHFAFIMTYLAWVSFEEVYMLNSSISYEDIFIEGFSKEIYRNDDPSNSRKDGDCLYFREGLQIK